MADLGGRGGGGGHNPPQLWNLLIAIAGWFLQYIVLSTQTTKPHAQSTCSYYMQQLDFE